MHAVLTAVAILASLVRSEMMDIVRPEGRHPLEGLKTTIEMQTTQNAADGVAMKIVVTNRSKARVVFQEPVFSAFLVDMNGAPLNDADAPNRFSCTPGKKNVLRNITLAPSESWRTTHVIKRVKRAGADSPTAPGAMVSPTFIGPAIPVPAGTYDVYSLLLITVPRDADHDPESRTLRSQTRVIVEQP